ncbi:MAG: hypothetical protein K2X74_05425 [Acetobacteraceae bacterium]|nr:hypothetical protein [Acetobacteraceae bacterium]
MPMRRRSGRAFAQAFGDALRIVVADYANFIRGMEQPRQDEDPTMFEARHEAAQACLDHLEQLLDLIGEDAGTEQVRDGFALLHEAKRALGLPPVTLEGRPDDDSTGC